MKIEIRTGSDSDIPKIKECYQFLKKINLEFSARILSAHRTPEEMTLEAKNLEKNNYRCSIAAAGGSAHLAGMTASETLLPVVALPVIPSVGGIDSLLSMLQMPPGIPNGCVASGDSKNAAILASRIVSLDDNEVRDSISKELGTKIQAGLPSIPTVNIFSDIDLDLSLFDKFGISYTLNSSITSPIVLYIDHVSEFPNNVSVKNEQISILAPVVNEDENFSISKMEEIVSGPYAWVGLNRVSNAIIYAAHILGVYFPEVRESLRDYRDSLKVVVKEKDLKLQKEGVGSFL